jgi:hypothetical protein
VWVLYRRGDSLDTFLQPHNQHLSLVPLVIYRLLFATAGLSHYGPYRAVVTAAHLGCVGLVWIYTERRVGPALATCAAALILFLGPGWNNILWPFQVAWLISLASGIGALMMLDRDDRTGARWACLLITISLASSGLGIVVLVGVTLELLWSRCWRRLWVVGAPAALYAVWWIAYQQSGPTSRLSLLPRFIADEVASSVAGVLGLGGNPTGTSSGTLLTFGRPLAAILIALMIWRIVSMRRIPARVLALLAMVGLFWLLTAVSRAFIGPEEAWASRYLYVGALFAVLTAVELARGVPPNPPLIVVIAVVTLAAMASNVGQMTRAGRALRAQSETVRAEIGALDISRPITPAGYLSLVPNFPFRVVRAGPYFAAERQYGTTSGTAVQLVTAPEPAREAADTELIQIHRIWPRTSSGVVCSSTGSLGTARAGRLDLSTSALGLVVHPLGSTAQVSVRRYATRAEYVGSVPRGATMLIPIGRDLSSQPWHVLLAASGQVRWCIGAPVRTNS